MKVTLIPSAFGAGGPEPFQHLTSYLINDTLAIDAGSIGLYGSPQDQERIKHIVLSHSHLDHVASLPLFLENAYEGGSDCVTIHASDIVLDSLRRDMFNNRVWPDMVALSGPGGPCEGQPFLKLSLLEPGKTVELAGLRVTPVPVNHLVPTLGFIVEDEHAGVVFPGDTGPTEELWHRVDATPNVKAVFLEVTFPNSLAWLADVSRHLTPELFQQEVGKLRTAVAWLAIHLKARYRPAIEQELLALGLPNLDIAEPGRCYTF